MRKTYTHITFQERMQLEALLKANLTVKEICKILNRNNSTIYREIHRGEYEHLIGATWETETRYSSDKAQANADFHNLSKGRTLKIGHDHAFARYVAAEIKKKHSPAVILANIVREGLFFDTCISLRTLYNYIDSGLIYGVTNKDLYMKGKRKRKYRHVKAKTLPRGNSIENRPEEVSRRDMFGHWEMDSVIGKRKKDKTLITLIERSTRFMLTFISKGKTAAETVRFLNTLEHKYTKAFPDMFKSITVDNGCEFADYAGMETSPYTRKQRTAVYYCHPYCSSERGTNENHNRFLRRYVPKGTPISTVSPHFLQTVTAEINNYPRRILNWHTPAELFESELSKIYQNLK